MKFFYLLSVAFCLNVPKNAVWDMRNESCVSSCIGNLVQGEVIAQGRLDPTKPEIVNFPALSFIANFLKESGPNGRAGAVGECKAFCQAFSV